MSINDLNTGDSFRVKNVTLSREIGKRLADMGFTEGTIGIVVRSALFGDPLQIRLMGYDLSIRKSEASGVSVELIETRHCRGHRHRHRRGRGR